MKGDFACPYYSHSQMECLRIATKARYNPPTATTGEYKLEYLRPSVGCMGNTRNCEVKE